MHDINWTELVEEIKKNPRPHAGHFSWENDRTLAELGVLKEFRNALVYEDKLFFSKAWHRGEANDPPDCEGVTAAGDCIGIEITELVDGSSIQAARLGQEYDWKDWKGALLSKLEKLVRRKDTFKNIKGGPYSQYILLIFSDEPWLEKKYIEWFIAEYKFDSIKFINRAFLLLSYDPLIQRYPCYELRLSSN